MATGNRPEVVSREQWLGARLRLPHVMAAPPGPRRGRAGEPWSKMRLYP